MTEEIRTTRASKIIFFLFCATIIFTALAYGTVHQPTIAVFYIIGVVIILLWVTDAFFSGVLRFNKSFLQAPLIAIILYGIFQMIPFGSVAEMAGVAGISRTISLDPFWTKIATIHLFALLIFFAAFLTFIDSAKRLRKIVALITVFGFVFAFFAILQAVLSPQKIYGIYEVPYASPFGSFVNRHNFAAYMEMTLCLPLGLMFVGAVQKDRRLLYITAIALMGIALILSGSRGGLISLLAAVFFLVILTTKTKSYGQLGLKIGMAALLIVTIIVGSILIGGESSLTRFAETAASQDFSTSRFHIWGITLKIIFNYLPFGAGLGAFGVAYTPYDTLNGLERVEQAHNDYLEVIACAGIFGLIIGGFFLFKLFRIGLEHAKTSNKFRRGVCVGALAGCFAILVHSLFDFVLHTTAISVLFLMLASLVVVSGSKFPDDENETQPGEHKKRRSASITPIDKRRRKKMDK
jgi:hypothetical protein